MPVDVRGGAGPCAFGCTLECVTWWGLCTQASVCWGTHGVCDGAIQLRLLSPEINGLIIEANFV